MNDYNPLSPQSHAESLEMSCTVISRELSHGKLTPSPDGSMRMLFQVDPGTYQLSVIADARMFQWNELYLNLQRYGNGGERTGPWDFNLLDSNKPLIPSYWVLLDGKEIGLWYFQRVSLEDLAAQRFRGRVAFEITECGSHELKLVPYRNFDIQWISARLEPDPEHGHPLWSKGGTRQRSDQKNMLSFDWEALRRSLASTHAIYAEPLKRGFEWVLNRDQPEANDIPLLIAAWCLNSQHEALDRALRIIDQTVAMPHWGNPKKDGYGHNGDMAAATTMRSLAWAYRVLANQLGTSRQAAVLEKLRLQGERFIVQALLTRDYWGGSLLQDHGWRSMFQFGAATLYLIDVLPEARHWQEYVIPRIYRALDAMPQDGAIPPSSYGSLDLYLHDAVPFRDALLASQGVDCFALFPFRKVVDYITTMMRGGHGIFVDGGIQAEAIIGGAAFLNRIASRFNDRTAAYLSQKITKIKPKPFPLSAIEGTYHLGMLFGFLSFDPTVQPEKPQEATSPLSFFEDSGIAHYRDDAMDLTFAVRCGPLSGYNAYRRAQGPCDRMEGVPGAGHFTLFLGAQPRLATPEFGYRMRSFQRSCLLIDEQGPYGDIGYPMSIPSKLHRGEEITDVQWNSTTETGIVRLQLKPAYPETLGVVSYSREFILERGRRIICRDQILLDAPRRLSWLFQGDSQASLELDGLKGIFGRDPALILEPHALGLKLEASVNATEVIWSYSSPSNRAPLSHLSYRSKTAVSRADIAFTITFEG